MRGIEINRTNGFKRPVDIDSSVRRPIETNYKK